MNTKKEEFPYLAQGIISSRLGKCRGGNVLLANNTSLRTTLNYTRDNVVLVGVERADLLLTFGLSLALE